MATITNLKDENNTTLYPITTTDCVYDGNNNNLTNILNGFLKSNDLKTINGSSIVGSGDITAVTGEITQFYGGGGGSGITIPDISNYKFLILELVNGQTHANAIVDTAFLVSEINLYPTSQQIWKVSWSNSNNQFSVANVTFNANSKTVVSLSSTSSAWFILSGMN